MLKRKDLAKEFELVVQQEIKNHNDSILATNISINELNSSIQSILSKLAEITARSDSRFSQFERDFSALRHSCLKSLDKQEMAIEVINNKTATFTSYFERSLEALESEVVEKTTFVEEIDKIQQELNSFQTQLNDQKDIVFAGFHRLKVESEKTFEAFKEDLLNRPNELWDVKKELEQKIESFAVDGRGVLKELETYKKEVFIIEKKIENIYTLISRLTKKVE